MRAVTTVYAAAIGRVDIARAIVFGFAVAFAGVVGAIAISKPASMDFIAHYAASSLVLQGRGPDILDPSAGLAAERAAAPEREQLLPLLQIPAMALLRAPIALLPFGPAFVLMAAIDAVLVVASVVLLAPRDRSVAAMLLVAPPAALAVAHGQTSPLALFLVALAIRAGPRVAGSALGLTLLRVQSAPLLLVAGLADPARRLWTALGAAAVVAASALVVGMDGLVRYAATLVAGTDYLRTGEYGMRSAVGWSGLGFAVGVPPAAVAASVASLLLGAVIVWRSDQARRPAIAAAWSLLAAPNLYVHDALLAYPVLALIASRRTGWDVASTLAWLGHLLVAPVGVIWSAALAVAALRAKR